MSKKVFVGHNQNIPIEIEFTDKLNGPCSGGLRGSGKVWYKIPYKWARSHFRSEHKCAEAIENASDYMEAIRAICEHGNTVLKREGMTGMLGKVMCRDCGYEREWNAY